MGNEEWEMGNGKLIKKRFNIWYAGQYNRLS